jgi:hypothetical protein
MRSLRNKSHLALLGITSAAMLGGFAGCSSSSGDDSSNPSDSGTVDGSSGDSATGDGSAPSDGGTDSGPTADSTGYVTFTQTSISAVYSDNAIAGFYVLPAGYDLDCAGYGTVATPAAASTSCTIKVCTNPISTDAGTTTTDAGATTAPNTGNITLLSTVDTTGVVLSAGNDGTYTATTAVTQWWAAGDTAIEVKSAGSSTSIPAFDDTALVGPGNPTTPKLGTTDVSVVAAAPAFDRGTDLNVTYSGGTANTNVYVSLTTTSTAQKSILSCSFDAANGAQVVKSADLEMLQQAGQTGITGAYTVQGRTTKATTAGAFNFNVILNANAYSGTFTNTN